MSSQADAIRLENVTTSGHVADWPALRLFNQYRLLVLIALTAVYYLAGDNPTVGGRNNTLFEITHFAYFVATFGFVFLIHRQQPSAQVQFFLQSYLDMLFVGLLVYASEGVNGGLAPLMLMNLMLMTQMTGLRHALLFAAIGSTVLLGEELYAQLMHGEEATNFEVTALLGALLFAIAWVMTVPLRHLTERQLTQATASRVGLSVKQISQLNEEIVRELDSGVVVLDEAHHVQLINDTARSLLACEFERVPMPVKKLCPELHAALLHAEVSNQYTSQPFEIKSSGQTILPYFIPLSNGGMLVKLDDHAHIRQQFQQLKLASLGRLSASIAHEIRNPLGAISQAVQLIQESPAVHPKDAELLDIASRHTQRINRIVEDVLQLSNRRRVASEKLQMNRLLDSFCKRFRKENQLGPEELVLRVTPGLDGFFDASHLDQILWNLCTNARLHNDESELTIAIIAHRNEINQCVIDVTDTGRGISDIDRERLFEPFYSSHDQGTGLGLYIIRELCELNNGQIECLPSEMGAHFRLTLPTAGQMAA